MTMNYFFLICIVTSCYISVNGLKNSSSPSPLILVPGDGGSRAYSLSNWKLVTIKTLVWVNFEMMLFPGRLTKYFKLTYDKKTHKTRNPENSDVFFPGWGDTKMIEDLDEWKHIQTTYFSELVQEMVKDPFFVRNKTIRGAPYDFRKAPNENSKFVADMKRLIEETYLLAKKRRVVLLGHSLGSIYSLFFLNKMTDAWKKQYIRSYLSVSGPLGGAVKALILETSGDSLGSPRNPFYFRDMQRSFPSTAFLLPRPNVFDEAIPLIVTTERNYTAQQYADIFTKMNYDNGISMINDTWNLVDTSVGPSGIDEIYCFHGIDLNTARTLVYKTAGGFPDKPPEFIYGNGDGTVNLESLQVCKKWSNVHYHPLKHAEHMSIVAMPGFLVLLKKIVYQKPNKSYSVSSHYKSPRRRFIAHIL